jgi:ABC-type branched-subunit amino acid transport system ATPase component/MFS family permease
MTTARAAGTRRFLDGAPAFPLLVLFAINFFDEFDTKALGVLAPEIRDAFDLSNAGLTFVAAVSQLVPISFVVFVGYAADRMDRRRLVVWSGIAAAVTSFLTGAAVAVWMLVVLRMLNGVGRLVTEPVHTSLLSDYYRADQRAEAFAIHRGADPIGQILGSIIAGTVAWALGWRWAFFLAAIPAIIASLWAWRLPPVVRGESEDRDAAEEAAKEKPLPFHRAYRMLYQVRTLRRIWLAQFLAGAGLVLLLPVFTLYWDEIWDVTDFGRGVIAAAGAAAGLVGMLVAGRFTAGVVERRPDRAQLLAGIVLAINSALLLVVAAAPALWVAVAAYCLIQAGFGVFLPPATAVASIVIPPRIRSQGFAFIPLFIGLGALTASPLGGVADVYGYRWALFAFAPVLIIAGLTFASAHRFVSGDMRRATQALETDAFLHEQRLREGARSLLVCRGIDVSYDLVPVLHNVDIEVQEGEIVALLGTNGAGKSTLLRTIAGLVHPENGVIFFDGEDTTFFEPEESAAAGIVLCPAGSAVFPDMTVAECLLAAGWPVRRSPDQIHARVAEVVELFPRLQERLGQKAGTLSGGEQHMLALAQALMSKPKLLMIDELTLGLSPKVVGELLDAVRAIHASGVTVVLVEQSVNVAFTVASRAYFLERGRIRFEGATGDLLERQDLLRAVFLR